MDEQQRRNRKRILIFLLVLVPALMFVAWSQASLNLSFLQPASANVTILLLALSYLVILALVIFGLILARILLKLYVERRQQQLRSEEHTSELQSLAYLVCRLLLEKKKTKHTGTVCILSSIQRVPIPES